MGRHRQVRGGRRVAPRTRPRYSRLSAAGSALVVTLVAVLGGAGLLPTSPTSVPSAAARPAPTTSAGDGGAAGRDAARLSAATTSPSSSARVDRALRAPRATLPAGSGHGHRVVFAIGAQRVWLVDDRAGRDVVRRSYLVSGSVTDNLAEGSYRVYSKSSHAIGVDDSGTMRYMVRFAYGARAAIGFHDIPVLDGSPVQTRDELGTPRSHGCIRQWRPDAQALWRFAPVGTKVVVVA